MENERSGHGIAQGIMYGGIYDGDWKENQRCGKGKMIHLDNYEYDGAWENDVANGFGTGKYPLREGDIVAESYSG